MPLYEYKCLVCEKKFEVIEGFEGGTSECAHCSSSEIKKVLHAPMVVFKGSGFYETEYGRQKHNKQKEQDSQKIKETESKAPKNEDSQTSKPQNSSGKSDSK